MLRIDYTVRAQRNLDEISDYTARIWGIEQAIAYHSEIVESINQLAYMPRSGREVPEHGTGLRKLIVRHHVAYYTIEPGRVLIRAIIHESRMPDTLRE